MKYVCKSMLFSSKKKLMIQWKRIAKVRECWDFNVLIPLPTVHLNKLIIIMGLSLKESCITNNSSLECLVVLLLAHREIGACH